VPREGSRCWWELDSCSTDKIIRRGNTPTLRERWRASAVPPMQRAYRTEVVMAIVSSGYTGVTVKAVADQMKLLYRRKEYETRRRRKHQVIMIKWLPSHRLYASPWSSWMCAVSIVSSSSEISTRCRGSRFAVETRGRYNYCRCNYFTALQRLS
jgi:hypothetical protein